jgi:hypothetical protein
VFCAQRAGSPWECRWKYVMFGIVEKMCGAVRACSEPGDARTHARFPMTPQ